ncbi:MAG: 4Fe-4S dicluster domain-containing protein [Candidatus Marinimicrobia bacterium]|jgi:Fe-S oxidoreductase|nr:4Fe-4S dicluster domain-containing protein [Candidatus Neomarinimicrobiota bacterium]MBT3633889.1 4Fe-4S dicluster domain-containing protein [Candidatus Neomarinimicrobiota bacterium]MBT3682861.1 4Fe-4S dicluster domain-containing protein [Candidatus Neomarinimicrobiota bacterium]MBT3759952.1 4Fe-4S dicluster domain-containing protein [Candidatus Neomarinimicrobiota bacterium]MBT3896046.1 4Fe-4S dicluster domain-containing protein [Candidatus Neomarinimicrobiota bacterium]
MIETHHISISFYIIALFAMAYMVYNSRRIFVIFKGKSEIKKPRHIFEQIGNFLTFGIAQRGIYSRRFSYATIMHFFLGWGFFELLFATTVDFATARGFFLEYLPGMDEPWFAFLNDTGGLLLFIGLVMALYRRMMDRPELLPHSNLTQRGNLFGDTGILCFLLLLVFGGYLSEAARIAVDQPVDAGYSWIGYPLSNMLSLSTWITLKPTLWWFHAITSLLFIALLPTTKMMHSIAVILNIVFTNRSRRGEVRTMHVSKILEDPDLDIENISLGVSKVEEFTWKQLLDSVSCTECARCTTVCPAALTGKPLSPMKIITDIRQSLYDTHVHNIESEKLIGGLISENELWSCTTCGACMDICPVLIDHVPTIVDMRRHLVLSEGLPPEQAAESLEKIMQNGNPWGFPKKDRLKWASDAGLDVPVFSQKKSAEYLYWVGCAGAYDPRNQEVSRAVINIMNTAGLDFAVLGTEESCTGDSARRLGEEYTFETMALQNIEILEKYKFSKIITQCPHCFHTLKNEYVDFGGNFDVIHHSELINDLMESKSISVTKSDLKTITYHDPCYLGRYNDIYDTPRNILQNSTDAHKIVEMENNRNNSFCCGAGGGNMWHEINEGERVNVVRFREAVSSGAETIVTACSFCLIMMDDAMRVDGKEEEIKILDIAEVVNSKIN